MLIPPLPATFWQPTDESRALVTALLRAIDRAQLKQDYVARVQGLDASQWARQLQGRDGAHVSLFRLGLLVEKEPLLLTYWLEEMTGLVNAQFITNDAFRALIDRVQALILELTPRKKRMARSAAPDSAGSDRRFA